MITEQYFRKVCCESSDTASLTHKQPHTHFPNQSRLIANHTSGRGCGYWVSGGSDRGRGAGRSIRPNDFGWSPRVPSGPSPTQTSRPSVVDARPGPNNLDPIPAWWWDKRLLARLNDLSHLNLQVLLIHVHSKCPPLSAFSSRVDRDC